jgi:hypothetical protein
MKMTFVAVCLIGKMKLTKFNFYFILFFRKILKLKLYYNWSLITITIKL